MTIAITPILANCIWYPGDKEYRWNNGNQIPYWTKELKYLNY
jgi:hypothetical protein